MVVRKGRKRDDIYLTNYLFLIYHTFIYPLPINHLFINYLLSIYSCIIYPLFIIYHLFIYTLSIIYPLIHYFFIHSFTTHHQFPPYLLFVSPSIGLSVTHHMSVARLMGSYWRISGAERQMNFTWATLHILKWAEITIKAERRNGFRDVKGSLSFAYLFIICHNLAFISSLSITSNNKNIINKQARTSPTSKTRTTAT